MRSDQLYEIILAVARYMPASSHRHRPFTRRALLDAVGVTAPTPSQLSEAFAALRARLARRLVPLFGHSAVETLFARSHYLATDEFPWLRTLQPGTTGGATREVTPAVSGEDLLNGLAAVLGHDVGLLVAFVGDDLVLPLVQKAWGPSGPPTTNESN